MPEPILEIYDPDQHGRLLTPEQAVEIAHEYGVPASIRSLAAMRSSGGSGPIFVYIGRSIRYPEALLRAWAADRTKTPLRRATPYGFGAFLHELEA